MANIGIFWIYNKNSHNHVIGKSIDLSEGDENVPGLIDSPDDHINVWENDKSWQNPFYELVGTEYQTIPRGRVIYSTKSQKAIVYMDKQLHEKSIKNLIKDFFHLNTTPIVWSVDDHYTTESNDLDNIFENDKH